MAARMVFKIAWDACINTGVVKVRGKNRKAALYSLYSTVESETE